MKVGRKRKESKQKKKEEEKRRKKDGTGKDNQLETNQEEITVKS